MKYLFALLVMTASMQSSADSWLCIGDQSAGFQLTDGSWQPFSFTPGDKYLIKEADEKRSAYGGIYQVHVFGKKVPTWTCGDFRSVIGTEKLLVCDGWAAPGESFKYHPATGHFLATRTTGYVQDDKEGGVSTDTPFIEIGTCSPF